MPPPEPPLQSADADRKARLSAALRKQRLMEAVGSGPAAPPIVPQRKSNLEELTGKPGLTAGATYPDWREMGSPWRPGRETAFFGNAANTLTLGNLDKIGALPALIPGGETYDEARQRARSNLSMAREDYPVTSFAGDVTGFAAPGTLIAKGVGAVARPLVNAAQRIGPTLGFLGKVASAGAQGAAGAAAYGGTVAAENRAADEGRLDPTLAERGQLAAEMAPVGAVFGAGLQAAAPVLRPVGRAASGAVAFAGEKLGLTPGSIQRNAQKVGTEAVLRSLERAGILSIDDLLKRAAKYGDKPVVTGELGQDPLNSLVALTRMKGTTSEKAAAILEDRVSGLPGRLLRDLSDETGISPENIYGSIDDLVKSSRIAAAPKYEAAEAAPFAETANLERLVSDAPILRSLYPKAVARVQNQAVPQIGQADQMPPLKAYDELKQLVDEEINRRLAKGEGIEDIEGVRKALVEELDLISGQAATGAEVPPAGSSLYAQAREAGGDAPRIAAGFKTGESLMTGRFNAPQVEREIAELTGVPLTAAQKGVMQNIITAVERGTLTPKRVKTTEFRKKLEAVFGKPAAEGIVRKFGIEAELQTKGSRWNPNIGAVTSQATLGQPSAAGDAAVRTGVNAARGNWLGIAADAINGLRRRGYSEQQLNEIGDLLLKSPTEAGPSLFPGKTPRPGSIPPPIPPAGRVRENPPKGPPTGGNVAGPPKSAPPVPQTTGRGGAGASEEFIDVYHASPHDFDKFEFSPRTSRTGEGNQTFGPGLYFSENPATHSAYMERLGKGTTTSYEARLKVKRDELIDHDKSLSDQPKLKQAVMELSGNPVMGTRLANMNEWVDALDYLKRANGWNDQQLVDALKSKGFKGYQYLDAGSRQKGEGTRNYVIFDDTAVETTRKNKPAPPPPVVAGPPKPPAARSRFNTRSSIKDAPPEYRDAVMKAPEGIAQSVWDAVRKSTGSRLPSPYLLGNRIDALQRQPSRSAAEQRTLDALKAMKARLEKLSLDYE